MYCSPPLLTEGSWGTGFAHPLRKQAMRTQTIRRHDQHLRLVNTPV